MLPQQVLDVVELGRGTQREGALAPERLHRPPARRRGARRLHSTIITTNLGFKQWGTVFPGAACVVALVDRFAQHCHRVEIIGESWRDKHRLDSDRPPPKPSRSRRKCA